MNIRVVEYQQEWAEKFADEAKQLRAIVEDNCVNIFHIGSTAVEGLRAKPIIDILLVVKSLERLDQQSSKIATLGYEVMGEFGIAGRRYFRKGGDDRTHQIHAFLFTNIYEIERHLIFRDYLRVNHQRRDEYGHLKSELALIHPKSIDDYGDGKEALVREIEREALEWNYEKRK